MAKQSSHLAIQDFIAQWENRGDEKSDTQSFWLALLRDVLGVEKPETVIRFEKRVKSGTTRFIDASIASTHVLIEQKSADISLDKRAPQSDGRLATPFEQAKAYNDALPYSQRNRWIVVCNFQEFRIHNMEQPNEAPTIIQLRELAEKAYLLRFMTDQSQTEIGKELQLSIDAGALVGKLYDALLRRYNDPTSPETLRSLNILCVRLVFCFYAEDAGILGEHNCVYNYLHRRRGDIRNALIDLFRTLDTPDDQRDVYSDEDLLSFPYVNGGLFAEQHIEIPRITPDITELMLCECSRDFDWSGISPTIFGAVFESTLNPETRRAGGMHYTSIQNIHRVIDPLFLDELKKEQNAIFADHSNRRKNRLMAFQKQLAGLTFLDPACGSGNFLTETYISLRQLENDVIRELTNEQMYLTSELSPIQVSIGQFYGIEINDFAVSVARTALWIAECQMLKKTEGIIRRELPYLPLKSYANIAEGNALRMNWEDIVPREKLSFIMGNPPFVGYSLQSKEQKEDILSIYVDEKGKPYKTAGKIDYVAGWYFKAAKLMDGSHIRTAFVSTNSITQGEQVAGVWKPLFERFGIRIQFAWRTFKWASESKDQAAVHCVIVGFYSGEPEPLFQDADTDPGNSEKKNAKKNPPVLFEVEDKRTPATRINPYLVDAPVVFIEARSNPISDVPVLQNGGKPTEGGFLILSEEEKNQLLEKEPQAEVFIRPYMMGKDFIQRKPRYCLWMVNANPAVIRQCPSVLKRISEVREYRLKSPKEATRKKAETPMLFDEVRECTTDYVAIPKVSSENRQYIPMEYLSANIIPGDKLFMLPDATLYHFGILTSSVHMAWTRAVCGRLKSDYSYSNTVVYNNFPWPELTEETRSRIELTAQGILDARSAYPECSLADLYNECSMPPALRKAHQSNDRAVLSAYGFTTRMTEPDIVARLMERYQQMTTPR